MPGVRESVIVEKIQMLERIKREYQQLREHIELVLAGGAQDLEGTGGWSPKDILAHIAAWEEVLLRFHIGGEPFEDVIEMPGARYHGTSFDEINAHLLATYESWSEDEVKQFADDIHAALMQKLEALSEQAYQEPAASIAAIGLNPYPLHEYIAANTFDHYTEHLEVLQGGDAQE